jgi:hypothetical protein
MNIYGYLLVSKESKIELITYFYSIYLAFAKLPYYILECYAKKKSAFSVKDNPSKHNDHRRRSHLSS